MLNGVNEFKFNEATMITIVQYYLDNMLLNKDQKSPIVTSVAYHSGHSSIQDGFVIKISEKKND